MNNAKRNQNLKLVGAGVLVYFMAKLIFSAGHDQGIFDTGALLQEYEPETLTRLATRFSNEN